MAEKTDNKVVGFRFDEPSRWMIAMVAMHGLIYRATFADEKRNALSIAAEAFRQADAMIEVSRMEKQ